MFLETYKAIRMRVVFVPFIHLPKLSFLQNGVWNSTRVRTMNVRRLVRWWNRGRKEGFQCFFPCKWVYGQSESQRVVPLAVTEVAESCPNISRQSTQTRKRNVP